MKKESYSKPIFIARVPIRGGLQMHEIEKALAGRLSDYHVMVITGNSEDVSFEVFYEKDHKPIDLKGIEKLIKQKYQIA